MEQLVLTREFFPDFKLPKHPTELDRTIQQIIDSGDKVVRISRDKVRDLLEHYLKSRKCEDIQHIAHCIVNKPANHMLWMLTSQNLKALYLKEAAYLSPHGDVMGVFEFGDNYLKIRPQRIGALGLWIKLSVFHHLTVAKFTIPGDYSLSCDISPEIADVGKVVENKYAATVNYDQEEVVITVEGDNITERNLITTNPVLEEALTPSAKFALLPESDDILSPAKVVLTENADNPDFELNDLADLLCVSPRTLQRKLKSTGTCFKELKNEVRAAYFTKRLTEGNTRDALSLMAGVQDVDTMHKLLSK